MYSNRICKDKKFCFIIKDMGTLDIILLLCFIPAIVRGIQKGFIEQVVSIISIFAGAWLAFKFTTPLSEWLTSYITLDAKLLHILSFTVVVMMSVFLLNIIGRLLSKTLSLASLGWINRLAGFLFSIVKAALIVGLLVFVFDNLNTKWNIVDANLLRESVVYSTLHDMAMNVFPYLKSLINVG